MEMHSIAHPYFPARVHTHVKTEFMIGFRTFSLKQEKEDLVCHLVWLSEKEVRAATNHLSVNEQQQDYSSLSQYLHVTSSGWVLAHILWRAD